jgi:hypothetical protein
MSRGPRENMRELVKRDPFKASAVEGDDTIFKHFSV